MNLNQPMCVFEIKFMFLELEITSPAWAGPIKFIPACSYTVR